jgi:hypothetical protein
MSAALAWAGASGCGAAGTRLGKVFAKLGIGSRGELHRVLADDPSDVPPVPNRPP